MQHPDFYHGLAYDICNDITTLQEATPLKLGTID